MKMVFGVCLCGSSLVGMYGKCGVLEDARNVLDVMLERDYYGVYDMRVDGVSGFGNYGVIWCWRRHTMML